MPLMQLNCPLCGGLFQVDLSCSGQQLACPLCQSLVTIPTMPPSPVEADASASLPLTPPATIPLTPPATMLPAASPLTATPSATSSPPSAPATESNPVVRASPDDYRLPPGFGPVAESPLPEQHADPTPAALGGTENHRPELIRDQPQRDHGKSGESTTSLLPPAIYPGAAAVLKIQRMPLPLITEQPIAINPAYAEAAQIHESERTVVTSDGEELVLRQLSPKERALRRMLRNVVLIGFGLAVLGGTMVYFLRH